MQEDVKKDIVAKIKTYTKENNQYIPIIYNLSYYRVYISQINKNDEDDLSINQNQQIYLTNSKKNIEIIENLIKIKEIKDEESETQNGKTEFILEEKYTFLLSEPILNFRNFSTSDIIHINYGEVSLKVEQVEDEYIKCVAMNSGPLQKYNSLSVEGKEHFTNELIMNNVSKLNREIESAIELGVEFIVMSLIEDPIKEIK
jgi:pyruvate kinase